MGCRGGWCPGCQGKGGLPEGRSDASLSFDAGDWEFSISFGNKVTSGDFGERESVWGGVKSRRGSFREEGQLTCSIPRAAGTQPPIGQLEATEMCLLISGSWVSRIRVLAGLLHSESSEERSEP